MASTGHERSFPCTVSKRPVVARRRRDQTTKGKFTDRRLARATACTQAFDGHSRVRTVCCGVDDRDVLCGISRGVMTAIGIAQAVHR